MGSHVHSLITLGYLEPDTFLLKIYLFIIYTTFCLHVCLHARGGRQISLQMVVSHHVVAALEEQPVLLTIEPSLQPQFFFKDTNILNRQVVFKHFRDLQNVPFNMF